MAGFELLPDRRSYFSVDIDVPGGRRRNKIKSPSFCLSVLSLAELGDSFNISLEL